MRALQSSMLPLVTCVFVDLEGFAPRCKLYTHFINDECLPVELITA